MANANSIEHLESAGFSAVAVNGSLTAQREKISCSMAALSELELLELRGKRIQVVQQFEHTLPDARFVARVMAVHLPAPDSGVETSLLLLEDGFSLDEVDYVDVSRLTLLEQL
ncbi:hypothetical protein [Metapseudomonas otitidis]|uniref:hypothetical protein n=1 Tax=Metapseudomonas otitidis TaxID=319939 RepID=UPI0013F63386|nr:hypothetical protein [Pseudomonas otitidis]